MAKSRGLTRVHAIANGQNRIKVVVGNLAPNLPVALRLNCCIFCNSCLLIKLAFRIDVLDMPRNSRFIAAEKLGKLVQRQPHGIPVERDVNAHQTVIALVDDDFVFIGNGQSAHPRYLELAGDCLRYQRFAILLQQLNLALLVGDEGINFGGFGVKVIGDPFLFPS